MWLAQLSPTWRRPAAVSGVLRPLGAARGFAKKRRRIDEYDHHEMPLKMKVWRDTVNDGGFYPYAFEEMSPFETAHTVFVAGKMGVQSAAFWGRAALAVGDVAPALTPRQLYK